MVTILFLKNWFKLKTIYLTARRICQLNGKN